MSKQGEEIRNRARELLNESDYLWDKAVEMAIEEIGCCPHCQGRDLCETYFGTKCEEVER